MNIELKDKIPVTIDLLNELASKGWQEIEYLQTQLANLDDNQALKQLLQNLITSYYVFVGGLENLQAGTTIPTDVSIDIIEQPVPAKVEYQEKAKEAEIPDLTNYCQNEVTATTILDSEPFEYFVDFDEPIGEPLSDEDLYGIN